MRPAVHIHGKGRGLFTYLPWAPQGPGGVPPGASIMYSEHRSRQRERLGNLNKVGGGRGGTSVTNAVTTPHGPPTFFFCISLALSMAYRARRSSCLEMRWEARGGSESGDHDCGPAGAAGSSDPDDAPGGEGSFDGLAISRRRGRGAASARGGNLESQEGGDNPGGNDPIC